MNKMELPEGYTLSSEEEYQPGKPKYRVVRNGVQVDEGWFTAEEDAISSAWQDSYGQLAMKRNDMRDEWDQVLAWKLPDGQVYAVDHLDHSVPLSSLEEVTLATYASNYEITNMLCAHCGVGAVDDEILDRYHLLNEGWGYDEEEEN